MGCMKAQERISFHWVFVTLQGDEWNVGYADALQLLSPPLPNLEDNY